MRRGFAPLFRLLLTGLAVVDEKCQGSDARKHWKVRHILAATNRPCRLEERTLCSIQSATQRLEQIRASLAGQWQLV